MTDFLLFSPLFSCSILPVPFFLPPLLFNRTFPSLSFFPSLSSLSPSVFVSALNSLCFLVESEVCLKLTQTVTVTHIVSSSPVVSLQRFSRACWRSFLPPCTSTPTSPDSESLLETQRRESGLCVSVCDFTLFQQHDSVSVWCENRKLLLLCKSRF